MATNPKHKKLIVIAGPTASGKTKLAIDTALKLNTEIISADSRQFYKEMSIGTAKPSEAELSQVKHHFINTLSIHQTYSAGDFEKDALLLLEKLFSKNEYVVVVGGSGLYIKALCEGFDNFPKVESALREQLKKELAENKIDYLAQRLKQLDPEYYDQVDVNNPQRVIRALEIIESTGKKFSQLRLENAAKRPFDCVAYGINWSREQLYERINQRVDIMVSEGLEQEARALYPQKELNALQTVGYSEWFSYFDGEFDRDEAIRLIKRNTRRYAKRQLTWFRNQEELEWLSPGHSIEI